MDSRIILAWVCSKLGFSLDKYNLITTHYPDLKEGLKDGFKKIGDLKWSSKFVDYTITNELFAEFDDWLNKNDTSFITFEDSNYPQRLNYLENSRPLVLFYQGNIKLLEHSPILTVVGSRNIQQYSKSLMKNILGPVCTVGFGVISGLAMGVDGFSHAIAIECGAPTIAVIGSGFDDENFYPLANLNLKKQIVISGGLVLSEYSPGTRATAFSFPMRNRILAALSELTWVVQASEKSGTLITAAAARDLGKTVGTTPASILDKNYSGNLRLLKDGASFITESEDIIQLLGLKTHWIKKKVPVQESLIFSSELEKSVYEATGVNPKNSEKIAAQLELEVAELGAYLTILELNGLIINIGHNEWVRN